MLPFVEISFYKEDDWHDINISDKVVNIDKLEEVVYFWGRAPIGSLDLPDKTLDNEPFVRAF